LRFRAALQYLSVKVLIELPREHYDLFAAECDIKSPEYSILKNSIVAGGPETGRDRRTIEMLCDREEADLLLDAAKRLYPTAAPAIEKALARASALP
jgi:hypothetical protein